METRQTKEINTQPKTPPKQEVGSDTESQKNQASKPRQTVPSTHHHLEEFKKVLGLSVSTKNPVSLKSEAKKAQQDLENIVPNVSLQSQGAGPAKQLSNNYRPDQKKIHKILNQAELVHMEINKLANDDEELPENLRVHTRELMDFFAKIRGAILDDEFIAEKAWERKKLKQLIDVLQTLMQHTLNRNQEKFVETENEEDFVKNVDLLEQFLQITILTNTYEAAQEFFQNSKDELAEELSELSERGNCREPFQNLLWQKEPYLLKWKFFTDTFTPTNEGGKEKTLIRMAQKFLYAKEEKPIVPQNRQDILLELMCYLNTVVKPAEELIDKFDERVLSQLSYKVNPEGDPEQNEVNPGGTSQSSGPELIEIKSGQGIEEQKTDGRYKTVNNGKYDIDRSFIDRAMDYLNRMTLNKYDWKEKTGEELHRTAQQIIDSIGKRQYNLSKETEGIILKVQEVEAKIYSAIQEIISKAKLNSFFNDLDDSVSSRAQNDLNETANITMANSMSEEECEKLLSMLKEQENLKANDLREQFNTVVNPSRKGLDIPFGTQLTYIIRLYRRMKEEKETMHQLFDSRKALAKGMYGFAIGYLRHLRAFNFDEAAELSYKYFEFVSELIDDEYLSLTKVRQVKKAYKVATEHLKVKAKNDPLLQELEYFQLEITSFQQKYSLVEQKLDERLKFYRDQVAFHAHEDSKVKQDYKDFLNPERKSTNDLNHWIVQSYDLLCSKYDQKDQKVKYRINQGLLDSVKKDFVAIFSNELPKEKIPRIKDCDYVGMTGAGLNVIGEPIQIQLLIDKPEQQHQVILEYLKKKFPHLSQVEINYQPPSNQATNENVSNKSASNKNESNNSEQQSAETEAQLRERLSKPWIEDSPYSLINIEDNQDGRFVRLRLIQQEDDMPESQHGQFIEIEIELVNRRRQHRIKLAKLMKVYMDISIDVKMTAFYWIQMVRMKGLTQTQNPGYPDETGYLLMLISWLQKEFLLPKAQEDAKEKPEIDKEKIPRGFNTASAASLRGRFAPDLLSKLNEEAKESPNQVYIDVNYFFRTDTKSLRTEIDQRFKVVKTKKTKQNCTILMNFIKKLVISLPKKKMTFDAAKGKVYSKRGSSNLLVSIKDPFIKEINHGVKLREREQLNKLVHTLAQFMKEAVNCKTDQFLLDENFSDDLGSGPASHSLSNSGSERQHRQANSKGSDQKRETQPLVKTEQEKPRAQSFNEEQEIKLR